jgi:cobalt-zinc-cadmium efflux system membrane fusion protein
MSAILNPVPNPEAPKGPKPGPVAVPAPVEPKGGPNWLVVGSLAVAVLAGVFGWRWYSDAQESASRAAIPSVRTARARLGQLHQNVRLNGVVTARNFMNVTVPKLTGPEGNRPMTVLRMVPTGVMVKKGQIVLEIDGQSLQDHIDDVHATVVQAEGDIVKRRAEHALDFENLMQNVRVAKAELDKVTLELKAIELRPTIDQEQIQLAVDEAKAKHGQLLQEVELKKQQQASEMKILEYTMQRHMRHRDRHKADLKKFLVYAGMDGLAVVQTVFRGDSNDALKIGDNVYPGQLALKVVDPKSMQVEGTINQSQVSEFRLGQMANISIDAYPGLSMPGRLYSIGALAVGGFRQQNYIRTIPVRVEIQGFDPRVIPDLSAAADILTAKEEEKTVLIPRGAIAETDGKTFVFVKSGSDFVKKEVKTGGMNPVQASVVSGLSEGEEVALNYAPASLTPEAQQVASR